MLRLLSLLQTHRYWPGDELANRLDISPRTLRRDIERLRNLGYPVDANRGVAGGYQLRSGTAMPPLLLDDDEAVAIALGLRSAAGGAVDGIEETSVRALTKIVHVMPPRLRRRVDALRTHTQPAVLAAGPAVDAATLIIIAQTCRDTERLRFSYTARTKEQTTRLVEPHRLVSMGRRWYLVAFDTDRAAWRTFRIDRLRNPRPTGTRFPPREPPGGDAAAFVSAQIDALPTRYQVTVDVHAPQDQIAPTTTPLGATVQATGRQSCRLRMNTDDLNWPTLVLAALKADFTVIEPPELHEHLHTVAQRFTAATRTP